MRDPLYVDALGERTEFAKGRDKKLSKVNDGSVQMRDYYRVLEDQYLNRWRWPKDPDYVVYEAEGGYRVLRESTGVSEFRNGLYVHDMEGEAARDYREVHATAIPHNARFIAFYDSDRKMVLAAIHGHPGNKSWLTTGGILDESNLLEWIGTSEVVELIPRENENG